MPSQKFFYDQIYSKKGNSAMRPKWVYGDWFKLFGQVPPEAKLVDVGCGTGLFLQVATEHGLKTFGLDISDEAVKIAKVNSPTSTIVSGSGENLPYDNNFFDFVCCLGSLEHFADLEKGINELVRVGKPEAKYLIILPNENYLFWKLNVVKKGTCQREFEVLKNDSQWRKFLSDHGLEVTKVRQDKYPSKEIRIFEFLNPYKIIRRLIYKMIWLFMPLNSTYQFVYVLRKKT